MTDKELFKILCPDGCWHEWIIHYDVNGLECGDVCKHCGTRNDPFDNWEANPDFSTWEGFGVMITEGREKDWWKDFIIFLFAQIGQFIPSRISMDSIPHSYIHPINFRDALKEFHKK